MEAPTFDYRNPPSPQPSSEEYGIEKQQVVESASASTANQENSSNFAYILTGVTLGVTSLITMAFALLMFGVLSTAYTSSQSYEHDYYEEPAEDWEHFERNHRDELDAFEEELWNDFMNSGAFGA